MNPRDTLDMQGYLTIHMFDRAGQLIQTIQKQNSIVYSGRDLVAKRFVEADIAPIGYLAVGTGGDQVDPEDTRLQAEVFRTKLQPFQPEDLAPLKQNEFNRCCLKLSAVLQASEPEQACELREAGLFNSEDPNKSVMYNRIVFPSSISKTSEFSLTFVWEIVF